MYKLSCSGLLGIEGICKAHFFAIFLKDFALSPLLPRSHLPTWLPGAKQFSESELKLNEQSVYNVCNLKLQTFSPKAHIL